MVSRKPLELPPADLAGHFVSLPGSSAVDIRRWVDADYAPSQVSSKRHDSSSGSLGCRRLRGAGRRVFRRRLNYWDNIRRR